MRLTSYAHAADLGADPRDERSTTAGATRTRRRRAARTEIVTALARSVAVLMSLVSLATAPTATAAAAADQTAGLWAWSGMLLIGLATTALLAAGLVPVRLLHPLTLAAVTVDSAFYVGTTAVLRDGPTGSVWFALFLLVAAPLRARWAGALLTALPVGLVATMFPTLDPSAPDPAPAAVTWALLACITGSALALGVYADRSQSAVRLAEEQLRLAFQHASTGIAVLGPDLRVLRANPAMAALLDRDPESLPGLVLPDQLDDEVAAATLRRLLEELGGTGGAGLRRDLRAGADRWLLLAAAQLPAGRRGARLVVQLEDITERRTAQEHLSRLAKVDPLTELLNRAALRELLEAALQTQPVAVLFVDLDRFKLVNDGLGHAAGDALLVEVAQRLSGLLRPGDLVARVGGDEFVLLCHGRTDDAVAVARRVVAALAEPVVVAGAECWVGGSVGIAVGRAGSTAESVLRDADTAMYRAKSRGGGCAEVFLPSMAATVARRHSLEMELRRAVDAGELDVHYQPLVALADGRTVGLEALVRWDHPVRGRMDPAEFVAVAEESDLVLALDAWVLRRALVESRELRSALGVPVSVNLSARELRDSSFADRLAQVLSETGTPGTELCLEITETALADDLARVVRVLQAVRRLGVRLAIDDFGTGHASLTYLARLPVHSVKIDASFVADLAGGGAGAAIVSGVVAMAGALGLTVVAEGVEDERQLEALRALGCPVVQGHLLASAHPAREVLALLAPAAAAATAAVADQALTTSGAAEPHRPPAVRVLTVPPSRRDRDEAPRRPGWFEDQSRLLIDLSRDVGAAEELPEVFERSLAALRRLISFTGGSIQLLHADGHIRLAAADPTPTAEALAASLPLGVGVGGTVVATGEPAYLPDVLRSDRVPAARRRANSSPGLRSWYAVPLVAAGRTMGLLQVDSTEVDAFDQASRALVLAFAPVVAAAVREARTDGPPPWWCAAPGALADVPAQAAGRA